MVKYRYIQYNYTHIPFITKDTQTNNILIEFIVLYCVEESCKVRNCTFEVARSVTLRFHVCFMVSQINPWVWVQWKHVFVSVGLYTLEGKAEAKFLPPVIQSLNIKAQQSSIVIGVTAGQDDSKSFFLYHLDLG